MTVEEICDEVKREGFYAKVLPNRDLRCAELQRGVYITGIVFELSDKGDAWRVELYSGRHYSAPKSVDVVEMVLGLLRGEYTPKGGTPAVFPRSLIDKYSLVCNVPD